MYTLEFERKFGKATISKETILFPDKKAAVTEMMQQFAGCCSGFAFDNTIVGENGVLIEHDGSSWRWSVYEDSSKVYAVNETIVDPENGNIISNSCKGVFRNKDAAKDKLRECYEKAMVECLSEEDRHECCDENGESRQGGYIEGDEAGIYKFSEFAMDQLLEVVSYTISCVTISS